MRFIIIIYKYLLLNILRVFDKLYPHIYKHMPGLTLGKNVKFWGKPLIDIRYGGHIMIGSNTQILSSNIGTHVNYGVPTKLFVDRPGATIIIGDNCSIGGACIHAYQSISIGENCLIGTNTNIFDANGHPIHLDKYENRRILIDHSEPVIIENNVWITLNCVILPGSRIGEGSIVSSNSVVNGYIPPYSIVAGNPARVIGEVKKSQNR